MKDKIIALFKNGSIDGGEDNRASAILRACVYLFPALVLGVGVLLSFRYHMGDYYINADLYSRGFALLILLVAVVLFLLLCLCFRMLEKRSKGKFAIAIVVLVALALRLAVIAYIPVEQESDFLNYYSTAAAIAQGDINGARDLLDEFGLTSLAGLAVINGFLCFLGGGTLVGLEIAQAFVECGIVFCIYLIGKTINSKLGFFAALLYAIYPGSIVFVTICSNQHLATLFYLLFLLVLVRLVGRDDLSIPRYLGRSCLAGFFLVLSYYCHPSTIAIIVSLVAWLVFLLIKSPKRVLVALVSCLLVFASYNVFLSVGDKVLSSVGLCEESTDNGSMLGKFVVGLNHENDGQCKSPYGDYVNEYALLNTIDEDEITDYSLKLIKERLINPDTPRLIMMKELVMWHAVDNIFVFAERSNGIYCTDNGLVSGVDNVEVLQFLQNVKKADYWLLCLVYLLMVVGCVFCAIPWFEKRKGLADLKKIKRSFFLPTLILDAWMVVFFLIEIQPRYRYEMMPTVFVLAGVGLFCLSLILERRAKPARKG